MVDDTLRYHTREVVGRNVDRPSAGAVSGTLYADGFNVRSDVGGIFGWTATWTDTTSATATGAALLTSWVSSRGSHWYLRLSGEGRRGLRIWE